jgi:hypothetical protein
MNATTADPATSAFALPENVGLTAPAPPLEGAALNPVPRWTDVLREQLSSVGLGLKREAMVAAGFATLFTGALLATQPEYGIGMPVSPSQGIVAAIAAILVSMVVWKGEDPARRGYHHAMPVGHGAHATARAAAGLAWTMAAVAAFFGWMGVLAALTGGGVAAAEWWQWLAPFAGATVLYLLGSALTLATSRPWKWLGAGAVAYLFTDVFGEVDATQPLVDGANALIAGTYGLNTLLTGLLHSDSWQRDEPWMTPHAAEWLIATSLWMALAVSLFLWSAWRQPER